MRIQWNSYPSPLGPLTIVEEPGVGTLLVDFPGRAERLRWMDRLRTAAPRAQIGLGACAATREWLDGYFHGATDPFPFPYHLGRWFDLSPAQVVVMRALADIPFAQTRSYEALAQAAELHPRQVGQLLAANHLVICIPCHRVVGKNGELVGYSGGLTRKRWLLDHELRTAGVVLR